MFFRLFQGVLKSNGQKFDSSYDRGHPFIFDIGAGQAIRGWDEGLLKSVHERVSSSKPFFSSTLSSICEGEERKLIIPPSYAYGDAGAGDVIPPGATLLMDVKCEKIQRKST